MNLFNNDASVAALLTMSTPNTDATAHSAAGFSGANAPEVDPEAERREFNKLARALGREAAEGRDSLPKLAIAVVEAAHKGLLSTKKDAAGVDDAFKVFKEYADADTAKSIHDRTTAGLKANVSKLRQLITMGEEQIKYDPIKTIEDVVFARAALKGNETVKVKSAYPSMVDAARAQIALSRQLSPAEVEACILKPQSEAKTLEQVLQKIQKLLDGVVTGEGPEKVRDQSEDVIMAQEAIARRLTLVTREVKLAALQSEIDKLN